MDVDSLKTEAQLTREQSARICEELSLARDALYRAAEVLEYGDPARSRLWEFAGKVEDEKVALMRRCDECP